MEDEVIEVMPDETEDIQPSDTETQESDTSSDTVEDSEVGQSGDTVPDDDTSFPDESDDLADDLRDAVDSDPIGPSDSGELVGSDELVDGEELDDGEEVEPSGDVASELEEIRELLEQSEVFAVPEDYPSSAPLEGGYYIDCEAGLIFVPREAQYGAFTYDSSGDIVNITDSTISGVIQRGSTLYDLRFSSFGTAEYRERDGSSWQWTDISTGTVSASNVEIFENGDAVRLWPSQTVLTLILILIGGIIAWKQFMKR